MLKEGQHDDDTSSAPSSIAGNRIDDENSTSSLSTMSSKANYKFTANSRGSRTGEGWSDEGLDLYESLFDAIEEQRSNPLLGVAFEHNLLATASSKSNGNNGRRPIRNSLSKIDDFDDTVVIPV